MRQQKQQVIIEKDTIKEFDLLVNTFLSDITKSKAIIEEFYSSTKEIIEIVNGLISHKVRIIPIIHKEKSLNRDVLIMKIECDGNIANKYIYIDLYRNSFYAQFSIPIKGTVSFKDIRDKDINIKCFNIFYDLEDKVIVYRPGSTGGHTIKFNTKDGKDFQDNDFLRFLYDILKEYFEAEKIEKMN